MGELLYLPAKRRTDRRSKRPTAVDAPTPRHIAEALRARCHVPDRTFDRLFPDELRIVSAQHWTPLAVAVRAAAWFAEANIQTVVDVGSGAGKFCIAAALAGTCQFIGMEQRPRLVAAARSLCELLEVENRVTFLEGTFGHALMPAADAYYFYNPFGENVVTQGERIDEDVELSLERYQRDIATAEDLFQHSPTGTHVLTYNGFGGRIPGNYERVRVDNRLPRQLSLWCKTDDASISGSGRSVQRRVKPR